jgi:hypothetical protein
LQSHTVIPTTTGRSAGCDEAVIPTTTGRSAGCDEAVIPTTTGRKSAFPFKFLAICNSNFQTKSIYVKHDEEILCIRGRHLNVVLAQIRRRGVGVILED